MKLFFFALLIIFFFSFSAQAQDVHVEATPFEAGACSGTFVEHLLPHTTTLNETPVQTFESNGSGLAINDLNNDGLRDIVLANFDAPATILWNEGRLNFRKQTFDDIRLARDVNIVDVDGDGNLDITFTTQLGAPLLWHNRGDETFTFQALPGVNQKAYAMDWADVDHDGDLDLVTGSYDAELEKILSNEYLFSGGAGVFYYENRAGQFVPTRLADQAQALTILITDLNGDGQVDLAVGNDFAVEDNYWTFADGAWTPFQPFTTMTHSTMSFDVGDINNDGQPELYATDMKPYPGENQAPWTAILNGLMRRKVEGDPQVIANVLQFGLANQTSNQATRLGIAATGWSWSSKFGDLNSDGFLDLYVVNGMIAADLFPSQPDGELVEANQAFRGDGQHFTPAPEWNLGSTASGRGMSMADLDNDGDLDIVVNNLMSPAQLFENQLCGGANLILDLRDQGNTVALGALAILHTTSGDYTREVRASSGYLSGDPAQLHFGLPAESQINTLEVHWNDGAISLIDQIEANQHLIVTRT